MMFANLTPQQQFVTWMNEAGTFAQSAAANAHVLEDYVGVMPHQAEAAIADATKAANLVSRALDLGYISGDDPLSFADNAAAQLKSGIALLEPLVGRKTGSGAADEPAAIEALTAAKNHFLNANGWINESIATM